MDVNSVLSSTSSVTQTEAKKLTATDFYEILAAEYQYQDPTNPVDSTTSILQMLQMQSMSTTEEMGTDVSSILSAMTSTQTSSDLASATNMIGKTVTYASSGSSATTSSGTVDSVSISDGIVSVVVNNESVAVSKLLTVK